MTVACPIKGSDLPSPSACDVESYPLFSELTRRGRELLGCEHAVMAGAMSWISERNLVAAVSEAGAFGFIACSAMSPALLRVEIRATRAMTLKPFGVNLIVMHPQLDDLCDVCTQEGVTHVALAGGFPPDSALKKLSAAGVKTFAFAPALSAAKRFIQRGVDAIILEGSEAGGHIGPVSLSVLCQEILPEIAASVPVFVAGGIGRGEAAAALVRMGASGVQIGTLLVCAEECRAHPAFKKAFIRAGARDAIPSVQIDPDFPVIPVRALKNKATESFARAQAEAITAYRSGAMTKEEASLQIEHFWAGALRRAVIDGDVEHGSLMAGQSVGMVNGSAPAAEIIRKLLREAETALR